MTLDDALSQMKAHIEPGRAEGMRGYHKIDREYLGIANGPLDDLAKDWRRNLTLDARVALADGLWQTNIYEARVVAAKLLTQARIKEDGAVWRLIASWVPDFDCWAIADHAMMAGQRRVTADPSRLDEVEAWTQSDHMWTKRAALVVTLPFNRTRDASDEELAIRERVLGWAAGYVDDTQWFIQKAVGWWLRDLSKRDPERVKAFLADYGDRMKNFARKEASKYLD
jgi:3-methyladenine DNA glycosylase AlkD